ncbi:hypothetical protein GCM10023172_25270 [Hymenobacter ginsengisoli]|uniref:Uncharacterized protein n=2 Tax=Hymenobacteraceae TaxID=1853232 RepID=A0ABP8QEQ9_9BACT|nr:hypothetical protein [Hymenobacter sp. KCTC 23674]
MACGAGLALGHISAAQAQAAPPQNHWQIATGTLVYLDGERSTVAAINRLAPAAINSADGMMGQPLVRQAFGDSVAMEVLVVTTKANANTPAVLALADKAHLLSGYVSNLSTVGIIAPKALAYITSHYPKCWLGGEVLKLTQKSTGAVKYRVQLADNWGFHYASFTLAGDFVDDRVY